MSIYSIIVGLLDPIPPGNFTVTNTAGTAGTVTKAGVKLVASGSPLDLDFEFTIGGTSHVLIGTVDLHGTATIHLDGTAETNHPVINAGTAVHWEPLPHAYVIVNWRFLDANGVQQQYRFQGKR